MKYREKSVQQNINSFVSSNHETFSVSPFISVHAHDYWKNSIASFQRETSRGFYVSLDKDGKIMRCGTWENVGNGVRKIEQKDNEVYLIVGSAYFFGEMGIKDMKNFKQRFKRILNRQSPFGKSLQ